MNEIKANGNILISVNFELYLEIYSLAKGEYLINKI